MKTHNVVQGTPEWHALRAAHFCASEAPAMMGVGKYKTRQELLRLKAGGVEAEISDFTQALFDKGHETEAKARVIAEGIIGDELYPATVSDDNDYLLASLDGMTMMGDVLFEHKLWNAELAKAVAAGEVPDYHYWQVVQSLMITGADKCLFVVSDGTEDNCVHTWVTADGEDEARLSGGWKQFADDLANYQHVEQAAPLVAAPVLDLPAVSVQVSGQIIVANNFDVFEVALRDFIDTRLIRKPETDQDFADLDTQIKTLKKAEDALQAAEVQMLAQVSSIDAMKRTKDMLHKLARENRLMAEKLLEAEKANRRAAIQDGGKKAFADHVAALNTRIGKPYMPTIPADFVGVTKNKRTITSIQDAVDTELARAKIAASEVADRIEINLRSLREMAADYIFLFSDTPQLVLKPNDDLVNVIKLRISEHKAAEQAKLDAERERIRQEEEAKARAEAEAKVRAEMQAKEAQEAQERAEAEAKANAEREQAAADKAVQAAVQTAVDLVAPVVEQPKPEVVPVDVRQPDQPVHQTIKRPTDQQIVLAVATAFDVDFHTARGWIAGLAQEVAA